MLHKNEQIDFLNFILQNIENKDDGNILLAESAINGFRILNLKKNDFLVKEHEICEFFCFINKGILQHSISVYDEEKTSYLALSNGVTSSLNSFLFGKPSRKSIKAIVDCELLVIKLNDFKELIKRNVVFSEFYYNVIEKQICLIDDYRIDLLTLSPEERYKKLLSTQTKLLQEVPLHYLASFLGISTRHMSRIRKSI